MDYQPYPKWVRCLDGAKRMAQNAHEHSVFTGIPHNPDGTPAALDVVPMDPLPVAETPAAPIDLDPLGEPPVAPERTRRRGKAVTQ